MSCGERRAFAPGETTIVFSPFALTAIIANPVARSSSKAICISYDTHIKYRLTHAQICTILPYSIRGKEAGVQVKNAATKEDLKKRLRRIEGQVRGVEKMVDDDRDCHEIIQQLAAIRAAVQQASLLVVRSYASQCLLEVHDG